MVWDHMRRLERVSANSGCGKKVHPSRRSQNRQQNNSKSSCGLDQCPNIGNHNVCLLEQKLAERKKCLGVETHCDSQAISRRDPDAS